MFSYYGSKSKVVEFYPSPIYDRIIEPFAGSARYSLRFFEKDITLVDKYRVIVDVWKWLQQCSVNDILSLPVLKLGEKIDDYNLTREEMLFLGYIIGVGRACPAKTASPFATGSNMGIKGHLKKCADQLYKIRHWNIIHGDYRCLKNKKATWFVDPPYQYGGHKYKFGNNKINFNELSKWCRTREGQVIVCENTKANWMDFKPMSKMKGCQSETTEAIWSNIRNPYDNVQLSLF
jgi:site-specific DNA-adenine methylase